MNIWLITIGEPLPIFDGSNIKLLRTGILADLLLEKGHKVLWWTSSFDHINKRNRFNRDTPVNINNNYRIILLHSLKYKKNISVIRIANHIGIAYKFFKLHKHEAKPDIILCSFPTAELSFLATKFGIKNKIPVILDTRDMWPDTFIDLVPFWMRFIIKILLFPMFVMTQRAFFKATAIFGITPLFVEWGLNYTKRKATDWDMDFPLAHKNEIPGNDLIQKSKNFWNELGITKEKFILCFLGTINSKFELKTVIDAANIICERYNDIIFVLCGDGDDLNIYKQMAIKNKNIIFPGWVGSAEIWTLMGMSRIGLAPYHSTVDFMSSLPIKSIEYFSSGLLILSSLKGMLENLLHEYKCGITYQNNDINDLVEKIIYLYNNPAKLKQMSENALKLYKQKFVAKEVYGEMIAHLEKIVKEYNKERN